jgi:DNA-binding SARP family transcriptional activator/tetratricopeptide (TPR) repeat protein
VTAVPVHPVAVAEPGGEVRFGVLGPLQVVDGAGAVRVVSAGKQRIVLAALLLGGGSTISAAGLAEALWDGCPPLNAAAVMRTYVTRLRRALGPAGARIVGQPSGWAVGIRRSEELDIAEAESLWRAARAAGDAREWRQVSSLLTRALTLWRGEPLVDVPSVALARREEGRLTELRLQITEARIDADLHLGRHGELVAELRWLAAEHPLREHIRVQLMLACYRSGQQAAALEVFRDARGVLAEELGVEPGPELHQLHQRILAADPDLTAEPPAPGRAVNGELSTTGRLEFNGLGGELKDRPRSPGETDADGITVIREVGDPHQQRGSEDSQPQPESQGHAPPAVESTPKILLSQDPVGMEPFSQVCQLPSDVPDFTGRSAECHRLAALVVSSEKANAVPVTVVSGPPGVGKTSLALHVAHTIRGHFPDGQLYVQLAGASTSPRTPGEVLGELLRALGVTPGAIPGEAQARAAMLRSRLADRRVLLVADDAFSAAQVRMLIPGTPGCAVIVTSRDRLAGLNASHAHLDSLQSGEALEMLGRIAGQERVAADPEAAVDLVAACGHLPLAVRIAGARLAARPSWPLATLAALVADERQRLDELTAGDLAIRPALELSYQALPPRARTAFALLPLAGPFDFADWVVSVLIGAADAADVVALLADKSMLGVAEVDRIGQPRYRLHDLLREYAAERLVGEHQHRREAAVEQLLHAWLQLSGRADQAMPGNPYLPPAPDYLNPPVLSPQIEARLTANPAAWFTSERLNLRHATVTACTGGHPDLALQLASRQAAFHHSQARFDEAEQLWRMVRKAALATADKEVSAHAAFGLAVTRALQGYHVEVTRMVGRCVAAFEELGDQRALAYAMYWRATCAAVMGRRAEALKYGQRGLDLARRYCEPGAEIMLLREVAFDLAGIRGREDEAIDFAERALALARQVGEQARELDTLRMLAHVNNRAGRYSVAERLAREGMELAGERHYLADYAYFLGSLGDACCGLGRYQNAIDAFGRALPTFREHGLRRHEALCLLKMAESHLALGHTSRANAYLVQCQPVFTELRLPEYVRRAQKAIDRCSTNSSVESGNQSPPIFKPLGLRALPTDDAAYGLSSA